MLHSKQFQAIIIFLGGVVLFTVGLRSQEIIGFESRFYLFGLEAWRHGLSWFPTTYQIPYPDYPATATALILWMAKLMGGINKFVAVFPSACAASVTLAVTFLIGALHSRRLGWMAVLFLLFTVAFFSAARTISLDQYTTAVTTLCFYLVYSASVKRRAQHVFWIFPLFVLGFGFRGPIGLIIPVGVVCMFYLLDKNYKRMFRVGFIALLLLFICTAVLLAGAYHVGGTSFMHDVLNMEVLGRMKDVKPLPLLFYFEESLGAYAITYPLAILVLLGLLSRTEEIENEQFLLKLLGWAAVVLIGLSLPADKKIRYVLAMAPALALICSYMFVAKQDNNYLYVLRNLFSWFCFYFPLLCLVALVFIQHRYPNLMISYRGTMMGLGAIQIIMFFCRRHQRIVFALSVITFIAAYLTVIEPVNLTINKTRDFVVQIENLRAKQHAKLVFYREGVDGLAIKYLIWMPHEERPTFIQGKDEIEKLNGPAFIVMTDLSAEHLPSGHAMGVVQRGKIGHESVIVYDKH